MARNDVVVRIHGKDELTTVLRKAQGSLRSFASFGKGLAGGIAAGLIGGLAAAKIADFTKKSLRAAAEADTGIKASFDRIGGSVREMQERFGTAILGNKGMVNAMEQLAKGMVPVVDVVGKLLTPLFTGFMALVVGLVAEFKKIPHQLRDIQGAAEELAGRALILLGKLDRATGSKEFGARQIALGERLLASGQDRQLTASQHLAQIQIDREKDIAALLDRTPTATGVTPPDDTDKTRTKSEADPKLTHPTVHFRSAVLEAAGFDQATIDQAVEAQLREQQRQREAEAAALLGPDIRRDIIGPDNSDLVDHAEGLEERHEAEKEQLEELEQRIFNYRDAWLATFEAIGAGQNVFKSLADFAIQAIADTARVEAMEEFAAGTAALAKGLLGSPNAFAAAGKHFAASAMYATIAGAVGGMAGGGGGAGGGSSLGGDDFRRDQQALGERADATIVLDYLGLEDARREERLRRDLERLSGKRVRITRSSGRS